ncbi:Bromodomain associated-domain-containing protein [Pyronema domesticum]|uniref:Similar to Transcription initiation factor TFIID subunit 3 acc. no. Q9P6P0 n=1 Tax=Pyronema omphalodes (strain CBS 100304) TaxID=1076935 RepID=U4LRS5_PYROM|nr:Bromodomain associated-domain-containing protein [Pyronema domesticum]CCX34866.1 Similar to Transcription initiation factor TFIID subunit 3; acc. no. Q9P6P0 [Pyronema omphalodes CBS 100304]
MSESELFFSLLRITAAQTLRAAGLTTAKPSVVDAFTDITLRYLLLLGQTTASFAEASGRLQPEVDDIRLALEHVGAIRPVNIFNDPEDEDTRGVDILIEWFKGPQAAEMRRVAGIVGQEAGGAGEEWAGALKKLNEKRKDAGGAA